ncbi:DUF3987 domain-containing protein [Flavobacterium aestivum]|uniref:DUF3987 domain-containing protein n=1 Tax=Flavobacterium aestivum TaxID=3003257 RepID=UPI0024829D29|nr:DUF3987 domain-containing protein [Flavobacterium aestivum]
MDVKNLKDIDDRIGNAFKTNKEIAINQLEQIISKMPIEIKTLINDAFVLKRIPKEYLLSSILFAYSNACGLAFSIKAMGYINYANLYFSIIGSRGDIKSPAMDLATFPLVKYDNDKYKEFKKNNIELEETEKSDRKQLFLQDATIESAVFTHYKNKYSIGIFIDELYFIIEKMANKNSTEGTAWRTFFLQGNTNKYIDISRKTTESFRIEKSYPTLLGSIQNQFVPKLFADGNLESGLIDRILFTNKLTMNNRLSINDISNEVFENYSKSLINLLNYRTEIENTFEMDDLQIELDSNANKRLFDYSQELINRQNAVNDLSKEYISKMMINIHKVSLLTHLILNSKRQAYQSKINTETIEIAILILEFYFINFKIVLDENINQKEKLPTTEDIIRLAIKNNASQKDVVAITGMNKSSISRKWNNELMQLAT